MRLSPSFRLTPLLLLGVTLLSPGVGEAQHGTYLTRYGASGTLLSLTSNVFNIKEGTLTNGRGCTYVIGTGIVCDSVFLTAEADPIAAHLDVANTWTAAQTFHAASPAIYDQRFGTLNHYAYLWESGENFGATGTLFALRETTGKSLFVAGTDYTGVGDYTAEYPLIAGMCVATPTQPAHAANKGWVEGLGYLTAEADGVIGNEVTNATNSTLTRSGAGTGGDPYTLGLNLGNANIWSALLTIDTGSNGNATYTTWASMVAGAGLVNDTAATVGAPYQDSPAFIIEDHAWDTDTGPGPGQDDKYQWKIFAEGSGTTTTQSTLEFIAMKSPGGVDGTPSAPMKVTSDGVVTASNTFSAGALNANMIYPNSATTLAINLRDYSVTDNAIEMAYGTFSGAAKTQNGVVIMPIINQTTTSSMTDLLVNRTNTSSGTGEQNLADFRLETVSAFAITCDSSGATDGVCAPHFQDGGAQPACDVAHRGWVWTNEGGAGVADTVEMCTKDAANAYAWRTLI